jgi:putative NADH-flavin reductase
VSVSIPKTNEIWSKRSVALSILFVGGSGQISLTSVREAVAAGHKVTVFNRGKSSMAEVPAGVSSIVGDIHDRESYAKLGGSTFDVVCAFMIFRPEQISQDITAFSGRVGQLVADALKPSGSTCNRKRRMNSSACSVIVFCSAP